MAQTASYNERLFSGSGLRSQFHLARFEWARETIESLGLNPIHLVEIGCLRRKTQQEREFRDRLVEPGSAVARLQDDFLAD